MMNVCVLPYYRKIILSIIKKYFKKHQSNHLFNIISGFLDSLVMTKHRLNFIFFPFSTEDGDHGWRDGVVKMTERNIPDLDIYRGYILYSLAGCAARFSMPHTSTHSFFFLPFFDRNINVK